MSRTQPRQRGFTLLELLVVLVIAVLLVSLTPPLLSGLSGSTELRGAARQLAAGLRFARNCGSRATRRSPASGSRFSPSIWPSTASRSAATRAKSPCRKVWPCGFIPRSRSCRARPPAASASFQTAVPPAARLPSAARSSPTG